MQLRHNRNRHIVAPSGRQSRRGQRGYSLLEVLIAVVILSIGLLGIAGLQTYSLQTNQSASQVSQATFLAQDVLDRMRANPDAARSGDYDLDYDTASGDIGAGSLAQDDLAEWLQQLEIALPGTTGAGCNGDCGARIRVDNSGNADVIIRWVDERREADDSQRVTEFTTESQI